MCGRLNLICGNAAEQAVQKNSGMYRKADTEQEYEKRVPKTRNGFSVPFLQLSRRMNAVVCRRIIFRSPFPAADRGFPGIGKPPDGGSENFYRWTIPPNTPVVAGRGYTGQNSA